jgi:hypothetical protein
MNLDNLNTAITDLNEFCYGVFNYYNGKINKINYPAVLQIEWAELQGSTIAGASVNPNVVYLYPRVILRYVKSHFDDMRIKQNELMCMIIETIIHELYHVDQIIDYPKMVMDDQYKTEIEQATELQTMTYIANHAQEIYDNFGVGVRPMSGIMGDLIPKYHAEYHRRKYVDHVIVILKELMNGNEESMIEFIERIVRENFEAYNGHIIIHAGDKSLIIQDGMYNASIDEINNFIWEHYYKYNYIIGTVKLTGNYDKGYVDIYICTTNRNTMVKNVTHRE